MSTVEYSSHGMLERAEHRLHMDILHDISYLKYPALWTSSKCYVSVIFVRSIVSVKMSDPNTPSLEPVAPTDLGNVVGDIVREPIDIAQFVTRPSFLHLEAAVDTEEFFTRTTNIPEPATAGIITVPINGVAGNEVVVARATRNKFSYAKKKFLGDSSMYLNPMFLSEFMAVYPRGIDILGSVIACPRKANGQLFTIEWNVNTTNVDRSWLTTKLPSTPELKAKLKKRIVQYGSTATMTAVTGTATTATTTNSAAVATTATATAEPIEPVQPAPVRQMMVNETPPVREVMRAAAYAALKTSCASTTYKPSNGTFTIFFVIRKKFPYNKK
jgi:hypothetical protein